ncbi:hypothetical protein [Desulfoferula mesophila]|uniref:Uncharacterized protein n=1 Tax=Desulfoferula mesophila TaxID=3058419 RepID=A0AAU9EJL6_9BACT|nr:hypothetical protein FAK_32560 [Desulfoferula mesophilus]
MTKPEANRQPQLNPEFVQQIDGKDFVTYQGLLDLAHQKGLISIVTEVLQYPNKDNEHLAVVQAVVESKDGERFSDVGDANPQNCNSRVSKHLLRMASTRAKARALRDLTNIGLTALEELADLGEVAGDPEPRQQNARQQPIQPQTKPKPAPKRPATTPARQPTQKLSEAQHRAIINLAQRRKLDEQELEQLCREIHGVKVEALNSADASAFIRHLQQAA